MKTMLKVLFASLIPLIVQGIYIVLHEWLAFAYDRYHLAIVVGVVAGMVYIAKYLPNHEFKPVWLLLYLIIIGSFYWFSRVFVAVILACFLGVDCL